MTAAANQVESVKHIVALVLENRSFDHMLGFLYADSENVSPATKQPFEGLTGKESNSDATGASIPVIASAATTSNVYFTPGANPGEGFLATNAQLFGKAIPPAGTSATNPGFVTDFAATLEGIDAHRPIISDVLLCWERQHIFALAQAIPTLDATAIPSAWPGDRFDFIWTFSVDPPADVTCSAKFLNNFWLATPTR